MFSLKTFELFETLTIKCFTLLLMLFYGTLSILLKPILMTSVMCERAFGRCSSEDVFITELYSLEIANQIEVK